VLALSALSLVAGVDAACPTTAPNCASPGGANTVVTGNSYQIGFINPFTSSRICIYQCRTDGTARYAAQILPASVGNDQYWPVVSNGMRYAAWQEVNGVLQSTHIGFVNGDRGGREVQCDGSAATQAGAGFKAVIAPSGFRRRLLVSFGKTIYTKG